MQRLLNAYELISKLTPGDSSTCDIKKIEVDCFAAMNDDFNTAIVVANLFEAGRIVNLVNDGKERLTKEDIALTQQLFDNFLFAILGIKSDKKESSADVDGLMTLILELRSKAKSAKDFGTADKIRDSLIELGIEIKDGKDGSTWSSK